MPQRSDHQFLAFDATPIHFELTKPDGPVRANLLIVHGAGEYAGRYEAFAAFLAANGIASYAIDLRGYGQSGGMRAYVRSFDDYAADISAFWHKIGSDSPRPRFLFGHSMGGLIVSFAALRLSPAPAGIVLSSPCFGLGFKLPGYLLALSKITTVIIPKFLHRTLVIPERLTHDPETIRRWGSDARITRVMSSKLFDSMMRVMRSGPQLASQIQFPVFIGQAGSDLIVDPQASRRFFDAVSASDKTFKSYQGFFHEILNEVDRQTVYADMFTWIQAHSG